MRLLTTRPATSGRRRLRRSSRARTVQDIRYTYDPAGNITRIEDAALPTVFHDNRRSVRSAASRTTRCYV